MRNKIEKEILETYEWYNKDIKNREFYDLYIQLICSENTREAETYFQLWEDLKQYGYSIYCPREE